MNTFTAQGLSDFYQKVADGGEIQVDLRGSLDSKPEWVHSVYGPRPNCLESLYWRIKPTQKVIDLSVLIESGIDCEFWDFSRTHLALIGPLSRITSFKNYSYETGNSSNRAHEKCRPRMNHIHAWQGGECPLPEGFRVKVFLRDGCVNSNKVTNFSQWSHTKSGNDIIAFEVLGLADGYVMPYDKESE